MNLKASHLRLSKIWCIVWVGKEASHPQRTMVLWSPPRAFFYWQKNFRSFVTKRYYCSRHRLGGTVSVPKPVFSGRFGIGTNDEISVSDRRTQNKHSIILTLVMNVFNLDNKQHFCAVGTCTRVRMCMQTQTICTVVCYPVLQDTISGETAATMSCVPYAIQMVWLPHAIPNGNRREYAVGDVLPRVPRTLPPLPPLACRRHWQRWSRREEQRHVEARVEQRWSSGGCE